MAFYKLFAAQAIQLNIQLHRIPLAVDHQIRRRRVREDLQVVYGVLRRRYYTYEKRCRDIITSSVVQENLAWTTCIREALLSFVF